MKVVEWSLWLSGALLLALYFGVRGWSAAASVHDIDEFLARKQQYSAGATTTADGAGLAPPKSSSTASVPTAIMTTAKMAMSPPSRPADADAGSQVIAVLRIPRIDLQVSVGVGTDESVLIRGAGLIAGSAAPGSSGNVAIAAHRDSFFRGLKDIVVGDLIELESAHHKDAYRVSGLTVVAPSDVEVLAESGSPALTLVTCYPFHFIGHAPQRFIVRATAAEFPTQSPRSSP